MALAFEGDSKIHAKIGNYFSLLALRPDSGNWNFHFGIEGAGYFTMRKEGSRFPLETADGLIGLYAERSQGPWQVQLRYTHISAHLADGLSASSIAYSREIASLRVGFVIDEPYFVYTAFHSLVNSVPPVPGWSIQTGGMAFLPLGLSKMTPFTGMDLKWKGDTTFNPSLNLQLGIALINPPESFRSFRFYYAYSSGSDPRGQFYDRPVNSHSIGVEMQI